MLPDNPNEVRLLTRQEVAEFLRTSGRTVEEMTKRWESAIPKRQGPHPSSPKVGLRPTRITAKMILYDFRDITEYLSNARREQEGKTPISLVGVEP